LLKDAPAEDHEFHVIAPKSVLEGGKPVAEIRPTATDKQKQAADSGLAFKDLPSAAAAFDKALAKLTAADPLASRPHLFKTGAAWMSCRSVLLGRMVMPHSRLNSPHVQ
jgi:hypothetical protein